MIPLDTVGKVSTQCKEYYGKILFKINMVRPMPVSAEAFTHPVSVIIGNILLHVQHSLWVQGV
jgi:hypothetical protein